MENRGSNMEAVRTSFFN